MLSSFPKGNREKKCRVCALHMGQLQKSSLPYIDVRVGRVPHRLGNLPVKLLTERSRMVKLLRFAIRPVGRGPDNLHKLMLLCSSDVQATT